MNRSTVTSNLQLGFGFVHADVAAAEFRAWPARDDADKDGSSGTKHSAAHLPGFPDADLLLNIISMCTSAINLMQQPHSLYRLSQTLHDHATSMESLHNLTKTLKPESGEKANALRRTPAAALRFSVPHNGGDVQEPDCSTQ